MIAFWLLIMVMSFLFIIDSTNSLTNLTSPEKKEPPRFDPHKTRTQELEIFGEEWVKDFGTECKCIVCSPPVPPKGEGGGSKKLEFLQRRTMECEGYIVPTPDIVPDYASISVRVSTTMPWANEAFYTWIDPKTGNKNGARQIFIDSKEFSKDEWKAL